METRPQSIVNFERFYLGAAAVGIVNSIISWSDSRAALDAIPNAGALGGGTLILSMLFGLAITAALWYFIARKGSSIAKWIAVVFFAFGLIGLLMMLTGGKFPSGIPGILSAVGIVLHLVAITYLFRPDTRPWFGEPSLS